MDLFYLVNPSFYFYKTIDIPTDITNASLQLFLSAPLFNHNTIYWVSGLGSTAVTNLRTRYLFINGDMFTEDNIQSLEIIAMHELGHILGLLHEREPKTIMHETSGYLMTSRRLSLRSVKFSYRN